MPCSEKKGVMERLGKQKRSSVKMQGDKKGNKPLKKSSFTEVIKDS